MKNLDNILVFIFAACLILMKLVSTLYPSQYVEIVLTLRLLVWIVLFVLSIKFLVRSNSILYRITFFLLTISHFGIFMKIMHWPGAGLVLVIGLSSILFSSFLLLKTGIIHFKDNRLSIFNIIISILSLTQLLVATWVVFRDWIMIGKYLNFFIIACIIISMFLPMKRKNDEKNMLIILALQSSYFVIGQIVLLLK